jgi:hypothetical protein
MTSEERFERIEHVTAMLVEERKRDREEYKQHWRDTNREIQATQEVIRNLAAETEQRFRQTDERLARLGAETDRRFQETDRRFQETDRRFRETDERISKLVSAIAEFLARQDRQS